MIAAALSLLVLVGGASVATACPMCKAGLAGEHDRLIQAWGVSIVFLLSMPFVLVTSFSAYMYVLVRRARREEAERRAAAAPHIPGDRDNHVPESSPLAQHDRVGV
ncbi:MAG TPA: hypothetical protein VMV69_21795 [Pirellulales bacterium]|nr:hypothetical protein [Pirellulales bacterium]